MSSPPPSNLAPIKYMNGDILVPYPSPPGKMAVKWRQRERERSGCIPKYLPK